MMLRLWMHCQFIIFVVQFLDAGFAIAMDDCAIICFATAAAAGASCIAATSHWIRFLFLVPHGRHFRLFEISTKTPLNASASWRLFRWCFLCVFPLNWFLVSIHFVQQPSNQLNNSLCPQLFTHHFFFGGKYYLFSVVAVVVVVTFAIQ